MISRLNLKNLSVRRGGRLLFEGLNLALAAGEAAALTGRNGAGKTSLLRTISGLVQTEAGAITFGDLDPSTARAEGLHLIGHLDGLKPTRTAREELEFWSQWTGGTRASSAKAVATLELSTLMDLEVRRLSAGQRRRLALARLIAAPRPLWLLDEPLSPLDAVWRERFGQVMAGHLATGGLIVAAVHDPLPVPHKTLEIGA
ncbi:heme ABC exporter ATP-binding protein CcmA [Phenylobacterium sp. 20VBR1]|uniref:Heme ABC exporter ATP-binding protein CcmA n=1 Tax=Phenylobacterium glaciei TaxID=2803784 RepID=A0A941CX03_9CAUL|nr:heme ABC exporter ATP-binding protein CcmA [Phenylobacterium glaciei]